jgi:hypothetical protein
MGQGAAESSRPEHRCLSLRKRNVLRFTACASFEPCVGRVGAQRPFSRRRGGEKDSGVHEVRIVVGA